MNTELWKKAIAYHGHQCAGLALGFRMGEEAKKIFGMNAEIYCKIPSKNCIMDGIAVTTGASFENGRMELDASVQKYVFYIKEDDEGWAFTFRGLDFSKMPDAVQAVLSCNIDFLFTLEPWDVV